MSTNSTRILLQKDRFKFSSAHMTVFPDGSKEGLHGHNYRVSVVFVTRPIPFRNMIPFAELKKPISTLCEAWDEKVLLAEKCPFFRIQSNSREGIEFVICKKRYVLPRDEVVLLEIENITTEALAELFCNQLMTKLKKTKILDWLIAVETTVEETAGQSSTTIRKV